MKLIRKISLMKCVLTLLTLFMLPLNISAAETIATAPSIGDGSKANPYQISTLANLRWMSEDAIVADLHERWNSHYLLTSDIDGSEISNWNITDHDDSTVTPDSAIGFIPIGDSLKPFTGSFDGGGYTISNLYINNPLKDNQALFGFIDSDTTEIKNLNLTNVNVMGHKRTAALVGLSKSAVFSDITVDGLIRGRSSTAGVAGDMEGGSITNSSFNGTIVAYTYGAGLIGKSSYVNIKQCYTKGDYYTQRFYIHLKVPYSIGDEEYLGGLLGESHRDTIDESYSEANVKGGSIVGGFAGMLKSNVTNSYSIGKVDGEDEIGGFVGLLNSDAKIDDCYSSSDVDGQSSVGGMFGKATETGLGFPSAINNYSIGNVNGIRNVGGFLGYGSMSINNSYATGDVRGRDSIGGFLGVSSYVYLPAKDMGDSVTIVNSYSSGDVYGTRYVGGFAGKFKGELHGCYTSSNVFAVPNSYYTYGDYANEGAEIVGSFLGYSYGAYVFDSYATGVVYAQRVEEKVKHFQGAGGYNSRNSILINSYASGAFIDVSRSDYNSSYVTKFTQYTDTSNTDTAMTSENLMNVDNFPSFNFTNTDTIQWQIKSNNRPSLTWQKVVVSSDNPTGKIGETRSVVSRLYSDGIPIVEKGVRYRAIDDSQWIYQTASEIGDKDTVFTTNFNLDIPGMHYLVQSYCKTGSNTFYGNTTFIYNITQAEEPLDYNIQNLAHLRWVSENSNLWTRTWNLTADINADETKYWNPVDVITLDTTISVFHGFEPIGGIDSISSTRDTVYKYFTGSFYGNFHRIKNMYINRPNQYNVGFFGDIEKSTSVIADLYLDDFDVTGKSDVGVLSGELTRGKVSKVQVSGRVNALSSAGGLIGTGNYIKSYSSYYRGSIDASSANVNVTAYRYAGGFIGYSISSISNCYSTGLVSANSIVGSFVGKQSTLSAFDGSISNSYTTGAVNSVPTSDTWSKYIGVFAGSNNGDLINVFYDKDIIKVDKHNEESSAIGFSTETFTSYDFPTLKSTIYSSDSSLVWSNSDSSRPYLAWQNGSIYNSRVNIDGGYLLTGNTIATNALTIISEKGVRYKIVGSSEWMYQASNPSDTVISELVTNLLSDTSYVFQAYSKDTQGNYFYGDMTLTSTKYSGGTGLANDEYIIANLNDLNELSINYQDWDRFFIVANDIDATNTNTLDENKGFLPIGNDTLPFGGNFDGKTYSINNLTINRPTSDYIGLFGNVAQANILNLTLKSSSIIGDSIVGGIIGYSNASTISNLSNDTSNIKGVTMVGGICGVSKSSDNTNFLNTGSIEGDSIVGGTIGFSNNDSILYHASSGDITGISDVGGIIGYSTISKIDKSQSNSIVIGTNNVGGLIGNNSTNSIINFSYSNGEVSGSVNTGGLTGVNAGSILNSYSKSIVTGTTQFTGGLIGANSGKVDTTYSASQINGTSAISGSFVGANYTNGTIDNSYYDNMISGFTEAVGIDLGSATTIYAENTESMYKQNTYVDWDFQAVWGIKETVDYPKFSWNTIYITSPSFVVVEDESIFGYEITTNLDGSIIFNVEIDELPSWLTLDGNQITGQAPIGAVDTAFMIIVTNANSSDSITLEVKINNAPSDITLSNNAIDTGFVANAPIGIFLTIDENLNDSHTYTFEDTNNSLFKFSADTLITVKDYSLSDYSANEYTFGIVSTDQDGFSISKEFTVYIGEDNSQSSSSDGSSSSSDGSITTNFIKSYAKPDVSYHNSLLDINFYDIDNSQYVQIFNVIGEVIYNQRITEFKTTINLRNNHKGIYFVKVFSANKEYIKQIVIK